MDFLDHTGHTDQINNGFDYHFFIGQNYTQQRDAQRAKFAAYQTYPQNMVEGRATLVRGEDGFYPGSMWSLFQPPQVIQDQYQILADMIGGGLDAGNIAMQPLLDQSS